MILDSGYTVAEERHLRTRTRHLISLGINERDAREAAETELDHRPQPYRQQCGLCGAFLPKPQPGATPRTCTRCHTEYEVTP
jgi:hypothetical protein